MYLPEGKLVVCDKCGKTYMVGPFINMNGFGESTTSTIEVYDETYDLCPKCTMELYKFLKEK